MTRIVAAAIQWRGKTLTLPSPARHSDIIKKLAGRLLSGRQKPLDL